MGSKTVMRDLVQETVVSRFEFVGLSIWFDDESDSIGWEPTLGRP